LVGDKEGDNTGTYHLYLQRTKDPAKPIPISYSDYVNGTIPHPALWNTYTFSGTTGEPIYIRLRTSWSDYGQFVLYAPNGTQIAYPYGVYGMALGTILPATGNYTILVGDKEGDNTGTYHLYLQRTKDPAKPIPITYGDTLNGTIPHPALWNTYTFNGASGDSIYIRLRTSWSDYGQFVLYAPNGTQIAYPYGVYGTVFETILLTWDTGNYTILVGDKEGDNTGTYDLYLLRVGTNRVTADFFANVTSGFKPLAVKFTDASSNFPNKWNWSFGDGNYSTVQNPVYIYTSAGTYNVSLNATNAYNSDILTKLRYINVTAPITPPTAAFNGTPLTGNAPLGVTFTDSSTGTSLSNWRWDFGDGNITSYGVRTHPFHIYTSAGLKSINLTVTGSGGTDSEVKTNYINVTTPSTLPTAAFNGTPVKGNAPLGVTFTDSSTGASLTNWRWDFGDGNITNYGVRTHPFHIYTSAGLKSINLTVTGSGGTDSEVKTNYINVTTPSTLPTAAFNGTPVKGNAPLGVTFTDSSTGTSLTNWRWDFGDGNITSYGVRTHPFHIYTSAGLKSINLTVTGSGGTDSEVKTNYINVTEPSSNNTLTFQPGSAMVSLGSITTYSIVLNNASHGLAGYNITVVSANASIAKIVGVTYPAWASLLLNSTFPTDRAWFRAVDFTGASGTQNITLFTITIRGDAPGATTLTIIPQTVEDRVGGWYTVDVLPAQFIVASVKPFPNPEGGFFPLPTDPNHDGKYEDLDGNKDIGFNDVVVLYQNMEDTDAGVYGPIIFFDYDNSDFIGFNDVVRLNEMIT
jgi:PKD repeat protein